MPPHNAPEFCNANSFSNFIYICNNSNEGWHHMEEKNNFPDAQNPVWWHSWHFGQCLVCTIPEYTGGIIFSHLLHSRHDKDDKVLEVEIERSSVWSNLELEAPTCAGSLDISSFSPDLTLWRNSFQFWPEDRLVGFITPPAPLDFRLIGSQAICCGFFFLLI